MLHPKLMISSSPELRTHVVAIPMDLLLTCTLLLPHTHLRMAIKEPSACHVHKQLVTIFAVHLKAICYMDVIFKLYSSRF